MPAGLDHTPPACRICGIRPGARRQSSTTPHRDTHPDACAPLVSGDSADTQDSDVARVGGLRRPLYRVSFTTPTTSITTSPIWTRCLKGLLLGNGLGRRSR